MGVEVKLGNLAYNGGSTQTLALLAGSPAIGAGDKSLIPSGLVGDQRGAPRAHGNSVDLGAFQSGQTTLIVTTLADEDNGSIDPYSGTGISLREAIEFANADPGGGDTIVFSELLSGSIDLTEGALPTINTAVTIVGPGANVLAIDALGKGRVLTLGAGANVTISGLTLSGGSATNGGGIFNPGGILTLNECTISGNTATQSGGGIFSGYSGSIHGTLTLYGCTLSGNSAKQFGGALSALRNTVKMTDCTVSGNSAAAAAGVALVVSTNSVVACTIAANASTAAGTAGLLTSGGDTTLTDTIIAGNISSSAAADPWARLESPISVVVHNLIGASSVSGLDPNLNVLGVTGPKLGPLAWNGATTKTMAVLSGSPALGAGSGSVTTDQRGLPLDSQAADIGAFQYQGAPPSVTITGPTAGTVQVEATFTLTATDPSPADQNGTFTYTIDWNGDGSDIQTIDEPAVMQVTHAYGSARSFTPSATVVDQDHRSSGLAATAATIVVSPLTSETLDTLLLTQSSLNVSISGVSDEATALDAINTASPDTWVGSKSIDITNGGLTPVVDAYI